MNYLLDANACIALINGKPATVRTRFQKVLSSGAQVFVSAIAIFELWYGVGKSSREQFNTQRVQIFLAGPILMLPFDDEDARRAGSIRAGLERSGQPIGAYDVLLAGQAMQRQLALVTANVSEFARVKGLVWQDWARD